MVPKEQASPPQLNEGTMTDRPILFSTPMVRALLAGRKTQDRRIARRPTDHFHADYTEPVIVDGRACWTGHSGSRRPIPRCYAVGDRLWVRETLRVASDDQGVQWLSYSAGGKDVFPLTQWHRERSYVPSIHMPRWASRLTLVVTEVRVHRLHDISEDDAIAEGVCAFVEKNDRVPWGNMAPHGRRGIVVAIYGSAVKAYSHLWDSINGTGAWDANPFVAAYSVTVHHCNIDAMEAA